MKATALKGFSNYSFTVLLTYSIETVDIKAMKEYLFYCNLYEEAMNMQKTREDARK